MRRRAQLDDERVLETAHEASFAVIRDARATVESAASHATTFA
jgi:hypothetical protein